MLRAVPPDFALCLPRCRAVHTLLVREPLDLVFCDADRVALRVVGGVRPARPAIVCAGADHVWEGRAGVLAPFVSVGDRLEVD